jgi:hypothetical protein
MKQIEFAYCSPDGVVKWCSVQNEGHEPMPEPGLVIVRLVEAVGVCNWAGKKVDLKTGNVIDYQPPSPGDDLMQTWAWDATSKRWVASKTKAAIAKEQRAERDARLNASDKLAMQFVGDNQPVPEPIIAFRQELRDVPQQPTFPDSIIWPTPPP